MVLVLTSINDHLTVANFRFASSAKASLKDKSGGLFLTAKLMQSSIHFNNSII
jgi:hypothetical protein